MRGYRLYLSFCCLAFLWGMGSAMAQEYVVFPRETYYQSPQSLRNFSNERWREVVDGIDYSETVRAERQEDENFFTDGSGQDRSQRQLTQEGSQSSPFWASLLKFLILAMGIGIVALVIARFLGPEGLGKPRSRRIETTSMPIDWEKIEDNLHDSDLDPLLQQALAAEDHRQAIRLYYLLLIKTLSQRQVIRWKRDKTNRDYLQELQTTAFASEFRRLTRYYERIWYGDRQLSSTDFQTLRPLFEQLIQRVQQAGASLATENHGG